MKCIRKKNCKCKRKICKCSPYNCNGSLNFTGYASMGSSHSCYYKCEKCKAVYVIYDRDSDDYGKPNPKNYTFLGFSKK